MRYKIFIDGQEGTTGLEINERIQNRKDLEILSIDSEKRKDISERKRLINQSDVTILCLPDIASKESVSLVENDNIKIIDASTAHRIDKEWTYGFPELRKNHRELIKSSKRVTNPGCYATGFVSIVYPLINNGVIAKDYPITCHAISGYSGGGKKLISQFESNDDDLKIKYSSPNFYALNLNHKHVPEMQIRTNLLNPPIFSPIVCNYYKGMLVAVPLFRRMMKKTISPADLHAFYSDYYQGENFVKVADFDMNISLDNGFLNALGCNSTNKLEIFVFGNEEQIIIISRWDNLGKGASGAAVQNLNIMLGIDEETGL